MKNIISRCLVASCLTVFSFGQYAQAESSKYSNNSRGPYHHVYSHPVSHFSDVNNAPAYESVAPASNVSLGETLPDVIDGTLAYDESPEVVNLDSVKLTSSATRSYSNPVVSNSRNWTNDLQASGGCHTNLDYVHDVDDSVSKRTPVLCESQLTNFLVSKIQSKLNHLGFYTGSITGELSPTTLNALYKYQVSRKLGAGAVTVDTLNALGINQF